MRGQISHAVYHNIKFHLSGYYNSSLAIKHKIDHHNAISQSTKITINNHHIQGGSNMTGTDLCVNKPHCAAAVRP